MMILDIGSWPKRCNDHSTHMTSVISPELWSQPRKSLPGYYPNPHIPASSIMSRSAMRISIPHGCGPCAKPTVKARTVSNVLALMDEDPDFTYAMSSAQQYAWLEQEHPDLFARMLQRIKEGRFIPVGGMWVESDNMLPTGESLIRQITFVMRYFREHLGVEPKGLWLPDSFGYCGAWPQIARRAGFEWFLTQKISWNDTTKFPHHSFEWG